MDDDDPGLLMVRAEYTSDMDNHEVFALSQRVLRASFNEHDIIHSILATMNDQQKAEYVARIRVEYDEMIAPSEIEISTGLIMVEVVRGREAAHKKHGNNSIEAAPAREGGRWLAILGEELGETSDEVLLAAISSHFGGVAHAQTYDADKSALRGELLDLVTVGVAWIASIDREKKRQEYEASPEGRAERERDRFLDEQQ